jgi:hypothetical protein
MAMLRKTTSKRLPSLAIVHRHSLNFEKLEAEEAEFTQWMTEPINEERQHKAFQDGQRGNLRKVRSGVSNLLALVAVDCGWGPDVSYEWLLCEAEFKTMYRGFADYMVENEKDPGYVGKTLNDLSWAITWAGVHWEQPDAAWSIQQKLQTLANQYESQGFQKKRAVSELASAEKKPELTLTEVRAELSKLEQQLVETVGVKDDASITDADRVLVAETLVLKAAARGGRAVDLYRLRSGLSWQAGGDSCVSRAWLESTEFDPKDSVLWFEDGSWTVAVLDSKFHWLHFPCADLSTLLELYGRCFPKLDFGDFIFTPSMHGARVTQCVSPHEFDCSDRFGNFVESASKKLLGVSLRPYGLRRMQATRLAKNNSSAEVQQSFSALMGTGVANLQGCYNQRTTKDKSYLAAEIQRHQDNPLLNPSKQNKILVVSKPPDVLAAIALGRLVRADLLAVYERQADDSVLMTDQLVQVPDANKLVAGLLAIDPVTARLVWRNQSAAACISPEQPVQLLDVEKPELVNHDLVYLRDTCSLAEIIQISNDEQYTVLVALQQDHSRSSTQAAYRFTDDSPTRLLTRAQLVWPLDLNFDPKIGTFYVQATKALPIV